MSHMIAHRTGLGESSLSPLGPLGERGRWSNGLIPTAATKNTDFMGVEMRVKALRVKVKHEQTY